MIAINFSKHIKIVEQNFAFVRDKKDRFYYITKRRLYCMGLPTPFIIRRKAYTT